jgi:hypothetical protein
MPTVELTSTHLSVHLSPLEKFAALSGDIKLPAMAIRGATVADKSWWHTLGLRVGTGVPGVVIAGRFYRKGDTAFVSWTRKAGLPLELTLAPAAAKAAGYPYTRIFLGVENAPALADEINDALTAC